MRIIPLLVLLACVSWQVDARAQDEGEARPASRGLLKRGLLTKGKQTTTTTTPAPQEEAEYEEDAEYADEAQEASTEAPASSTEGKKLVAGGVRPFRSNTDLLETLKRRRAQAAEAKLHGGHTSAPTAATQDSPVEVPAPAKSSYIKVKPGSKLKLQPQNTESRRNISTKPGRRRNVVNTTVQPVEEQIQTTECPPTTTKRNVRAGRQRATKVIETTPTATQNFNKTIGKKRFNNGPKESIKEEEPAVAKPSRGRFGRPSSRSIQEDHEEQNESAPAPARAGRTFSRRAN